MSEWVNRHASHCYVARAISEQQSEARCVAGIELELLRLALLHWRFKVSDRVAGRIETQEKVAAHRELLARHSSVLAAAASGTDVPSR